MTTPRTARLYSRLVMRAIRTADYATRMMRLALADGLLDGRWHANVKDAR